MNRKGFVVPVAFIALMFFAILGIVTMMTGSSDYSQTSRIYYSAKADSVAASVHEEVQCVLYKIFSLPLPKLNAALGNFGEQALAIREQLLTEIKQKVADAPNDPNQILEFSILIVGNGSGVDGGLWIPNAMQTADNLGVEIALAEVKFYGFRQTNISGDKAWQQENMYYRCPYGVLDYNPDGREENKDHLSDELDTGENAVQPGAGEDDGSDVLKEVKVTKDYIGYYTIRIKTACARAGASPIVRERMYSHDVKLANVAPIAREFAVFSYASTTKNAGTVPPEYAEEDLNKGGGLKIYPNRWGRVYVNGPFLMETEGWGSGVGGLFPWNHTDEFPDINGEDADGNYRPTVANTYPRMKESNATSDKDYRMDWWGWAFLPSQRAPTIDTSLGAYSGPARSLATEKGAWFGNAIKALADLTLVDNLWNAIKNQTWDKDLTTLEPASDIRLTSSTSFWEDEARWICASKDADKYNRAFCFVGDPVDGAFTAPAIPEDQAGVDPPDPDAYRFSMYRGILGEWVHPEIDTEATLDEIEDAEEAGNTEISISDNKSAEFKAIRPFWTKTADWGDMGDDEPDSDDARLYSIQPEGMLLGKFSVAKFTRTDRYWGAKTEYKTEPLSDDNYVFPYGLRWECRHRDGIFRFMLRSMTSTLTFLVGGLTGATVGNIIGRAIDIGGQEFFGMEQGDEHFNISKQAAMDLKAYFPPGYRVLNRMAVRRYRRLDSLIPVDNRDTVPVNLDGIIWCDDLNTNRGFKYYGRGMLVSSGMNSEPGGEDMPEMKAPILPHLGLTEGKPEDVTVDLKTLWNDDPDAQTEDGQELEVNPHYLTIATTRPDSKYAWKGGRRIVFNYDGEQPAAGYIAASVLSEHGISAKANKNIHISGNYICQFMNKGKIPGGDDNYDQQSNIYVSYDQRYYPERWAKDDNGEYEEEDGHRTELVGESSIETIPSPVEDFEKAEFYSFNFSRKICGLRFGLQSQGQ